MSDELRELIANAAAELNPETDNQDVVENVEEDVEEPIIDETEDAADEEAEEADETEDEEESDSDEDSDEGSGEFTVKVNGEEFKVTEAELKAGYQRQADYTRAKQAVQAEKEELESVKAQFAEQIGALDELDAAWEENPVGVLAHFASNTANPTQAISMLIRDMAAADLLDRQFLDMFGITKEIQREWAKESELDNLRTQNERGTSKRDAELEEARMELEVQKAIAEYDNQIDDIIDAEGLNFNTKQRAAFRQELAAYAADNELTNLKAAYKAFKYEESQNNKRIAAKTVERAKAKKATNVVSRSGAGEGSPVSDSSDLNSVIRAAMKEASL